jgi:hypothetical protein
VALQSRWSATLIKEDKEWLLVSFSASANAFNNQVIDLYRLRTRLLSAAVGAGIGVAIGLSVGITIGLLGR